MRKIIMLTVLVALAATAMPALAELQTVQVGGEVRLRGNWIRNMYATPGPWRRQAMGPALVERRWGSGLWQRPIGGPFNGLGVYSMYGWEDRPDVKVIEQRTKLNVKADFTDSVSAFIEFDSYDIWGEDFRSDYVTGVDSRANSADDVEVYQAYIEANDMFGHPLRLRMGRQELVFGSEFLLGNNDNAFFFRGLSFDAIRLTYAADTFSVDAFWAKLAERSPIEQDGDVDLYGLYGSYTGLENWVFDLYGLLLRDAREIHDSFPFPPLQWWEQDVLGVNDYDVTNLYTVGTRAAGTWNALDVEAEVAYQWGDVDQAGSTFAAGRYGADDAEVAEWGGRMEVGYSFDFTCQPRLFAGFTYYGGEDERDISFAEWLNPFERSESSVSFNRLFSDEVASGFMDADRSFSNGYIIKAGINAQPLEKLTVMLCASHFEALENFHQPIGFQLGRHWVPCAPFLSFWVDKSDAYLGTEALLHLEYQYSEDLSFHVGWSHWFNGDAEGNFSTWNGLGFTGGADDEDADYIYWGTKLCF